VGGGRTGEGAGVRAAWRASPPTADVPKMVLLTDNVPMAIRLTEQQQRLLDSTEAQPPQVVDPRTNVAYVLIPLTEYEVLREVVEDEKQQKDIRTVALRNAGRRMVEAP